MIEKFFLPYLKAIRGAAYSIQQSLEGYGLISSNFVEKNIDGRIINSYWSPLEASIVWFFLLLVLATILFLAVLLSSYTLGRRKGLLAGFVIMSIPGLCSIAGFWPEFNFVPRIYVIGGKG